MENERPMKYGSERAIISHFVIDLLRNIHEAYAPRDVRFGATIETFYIGLCLLFGDVERRPFKVSKVADYMNLPRTTVIRRLEVLKKWKLIERRGTHYYVLEDALNTPISDRAYRRTRSLIARLIKNLSDLDAK
jgi:hypothetical protein